MSFADSLKDAEANKIKRENEEKEEMFNKYVHAFYKYFKKECMWRAENGYTTIYLRHDKSPSIYDDKLLEEFGKFLTDERADQMIEMLKELLKTDGFNNYEVYKRKGHEIWHYEYETVEYDAGMKLLSTIFLNGEETYQKKHVVVDGYLYLVDIKAEW